MKKKSAIVAIVTLMTSLGGALSLEAASPASQAKAPATASAVPAKAVHSKKKMHTARHVKKHRTVVPASNPAK